MANLTISVKFAYNGHTKEDGTANISLILCYGGKRRVYNTGISIEQKYFNERNQDAPVKGHKHSAEINCRIRELKNKYQNRFTELQIKGDVFDIDDILNIPERQTKNFIEYIKIQSQTKSNHYGEKVNKAQQNAYKNLIENLIQFAKSKVISFDKINLDFIKRFDLYLQTAPINKGVPLHHNTIKKRHDILRSFVRLAVDDGLIEKNPYSKFKYKAIPTKRDYLNDEELKKIENCFVSDDLQLSKDLFLFGCYTGLRFQDIMDLKKSNITRTSNNVFLHTRENKTQKLNDTNLSVQFKGKAIDIIDKYQNTNSDYLFPRITNQAINRNLKSIASINQINKKLSFHVSRHTFGSFLAIHSGDVLLIKERMNHADIKTTERYIHETQKDIENKLKKVDWNY